MAIDIAALETFVKHAGMAPPSTPGTEAMAAAANAAKPPGSGPLPKFVAPQQEEQEEAPGEDPNQPTLEDIAKKDKEIQALRGKVQLEKLEREKVEAKAEIERAQQAASVKLQQQQAALEAARQTVQAEAVKQKASVGEEAAHKKVEVAEEKAKALMAIADMNAKRYVKTTDDARKKTDEYIKAKQQAFADSHPSVSAALQSQMTGAIAAMSRIGKAQRKAHTALPRPGAPPVLFKSGATVQPGTMQQTPSAGMPGKPQLPSSSSAPKPATSSTAPPKPQTSPVTNIPRPGAPPKPVTSTSSNPWEADIRAAQAERAKAIRKEIRGQYYAGSRTNLAQTAVGSATIENDLYKNKHEGTTGRDVYLRQVLEGAKKVEGVRKGELQQKANAGDIKARIELANREDLDDERTSYNWYGGMDTQGTALDQIRNQYKKEQEYKNSWMGKMRESGTMGAITAGTIEVLRDAPGMILSPIANLFNIYNEGAQLEAMAKRRGVDVKYFGSNSAEHKELLEDFNEAARARGISTNPWSRIGDAAMTLADPALTFFSGGAWAGAKAGFHAARAGARVWKATRAGFKSGLKRPTVRGLATQGLTASAGMKLLGGGAYYEHPDLYESTGYNSLMNQYYNGELTKSSAFRKLASTRGSMNTAQILNDGYDHTRVDGPQYTNPYNNALGRIMEFASPMVQSLTGGAVQLVRANKLPYNAAPMWDPASIAGNFLNTYADRRFKQTPHLSPAITAMINQYAGGWQ